MFRAIGVQVRDVLRCSGLQVFLGVQGYRCFEVFRATDVLRWSGDGCSEVFRATDVLRCSGLQPAKRLCDASSVLVGVELPISFRFQPSPLASKLLAASRKGEHCASVSPCQYIAYPQQVLCSAFSRRQVLLGTVRPQH